MAAQRCYQPLSKEQHSALCRKAQGRTQIQVWYPRSHGMASKGKRPVSSPYSPKLDRMLMRTVGQPTEAAGQQQSLVSR
jgi:hypothetical protein